MQLERQPFCTKWFNFRFFVNSFFIINFQKLYFSFFLSEKKLGEVSTDIFSIGFIIESIEYKNIQFSCWDVGGEVNLSSKFLSLSLFFFEKSIKITLFQDKIRPLYRSYYQDSTAIIFMVDSNDRDRISEARTELFHFVRDEFLSDVPLLVIANKQVIFFFFLVVSKKMKK